MTSSAPAGWCSSVPCLDAKRKQDVGRFRSRCHTVSAVNRATTARCSSAGHGGRQKNSENEQKFRENLGRIWKRREMAAA